MRFSCYDLQQFSSEIKRGLAYVLYLANSVVFDPLTSEPECWEGLMRQ